MREHKPHKRSRLLVIIGPGLLMAATGVGAGDLATAGFAGSRLGPVVLWAVVVGAIFKFVLTEGIARWQLVTGETILHGALTRFGWPVRVLFFIYLLPFSFVVGRALIGACGVTAHAILPLPGGAETSTLLLGIAHSVGALVLLRFASFALFERLMTGCILVMFFTVVVGAVMVSPDWAAIARGLLVPRIPDMQGAGLTWTVALIGGVGGTLTILCYSYWIAEQGRRTTDDIRTCRIDLGVGYGATALFGLATLIIASGVHVESGGTTLIIDLADSLGTRVHPAARIAFLLGAWATVFSSLLGVWQAVPFIFADFWRVARGRQGEAITTRSAPYVSWQVGIAVLPIAGLLPLSAAWWSSSFEHAQKVYAITGALFLPLLAITLLVLNSPRKAMGRHRNRVSAVALLIVLLFFAWTGITRLIDMFGVTPG